MADTAASVPTVHRRLYLDDLIQKLEEVKLIDELVTFRCDQDRLVVFLRRDPSAEQQTALIAAGWVLWDADLDWDDHWVRPIVLHFHREVF